MNMLLLYFSYPGYSNDICNCLVTHVWIDFVYMFVWILLRCNISLTITLDRWKTFFLACDESLLVCSLSRGVFPRVSNGHTHSPFHVLEPFMSLPWIAMLVTPLLPTRTYFLPLRKIVFKAIPYNPLVGLLHQMVWGLVWTSYWGDPWTCWWVQHRQNFCTTRRARWQAESSHLFWISAYLSWLTTNFLFWCVCLMEMTSKSWKRSRITCHIKHKMVEAT